MIYKVSQQELVLALSKELKGIIKMPEWALMAKTGAHRETMPKNPDWWYIRAASILRMIHIRGPIGVGKLRTRYGGRKNRGVRPDRFALASGKVIRVILQQLEEAKLIKQATVGSHKGRVITPAGGSLLAKAAKSLPKAQEESSPAPVVEKAKPVKKEAPKTEEKKVEVEKSPKPKVEEKKAEEPKAEEKPVEKKAEVKEEKPKPVKEETEPTPQTNDSPSPVEKGVMNDE